MSGGLAGMRGGQGIGLSIVAAIATAHGAELSALPRTGGGGLDVSVTVPTLVDAVKTRSPDCWTPESRLSDSGNR